jgi:hypothetical protein
MNCCCICRLGETDGGGLETFRVEGSTIGMALRVRWACGWCSFACVELLCWKPGAYGFGAEESTKDGVGCSWCWRGDCSGEPLDSDERSEPEEWMDWSCSSNISACWARCDDMGGWQMSRAKLLTSSSVSRWNGQNISSSSMSKDRAASKSRLNASIVGGSTLNSFGVRTWLVLLGRDPRRPPRPAAVVVMRMGVEVLRLVLPPVVEELRHGCGVC